MSHHDTRFRQHREKQGSAWVRSVCALLVALPFWLGAGLPQEWISRCVFPTGDLPVAALAEEAAPAGTTDFYQYTDAQSVIHFVDTLEKVPAQYRSRVVVRRDAPASPSPTTTLQMVNNQILVPVTLKHGGRNVQALFLLDTGSALTCVTEQFAARLALSPAATRTVAMGLADGSMIEFGVAQVDAVVVGERSKSPMEIGILPHFDTSELHDGLLGLDFFKDFQYQIDVGHGVIRWQ